jgi:hypothetical protein
MRFSYLCIDQLASIRLSKNTLCVVCCSDRCKLSRDRTGTDEHSCHKIIHKQQYIYRPLRFAILCGCYTCIVSAPCKHTLAGGPRQEFQPVVDAISSLKSLESLLITDYTWTDTPFTFIFPPSLTTLTCRGPGESYIQALVSSNVTNFSTSFMYPGVGNSRSVVGFLNQTNILHLEIPEFVANGEEAILLLKTLVRSKLES